jgi:GAF domain-containing protein
VADPGKAPLYTEEHRAEARKRGWVSLLSAPMIAEEQVIGILDVYTERVRHFTAEDRDLLNTFASQAALAVRRAGVEEQRARMLQKLQEISALPLSGRTGVEAEIYEQFADKVVEAVHDLTGDDVALWLPDESGDQWRIWAHVGLEEAHAQDDRLGLDDSVSGLAMRTRLLIALFDIFDPNQQPPFKFPERARRMGWKSVMIVPLLTPDRALGTLSVYSHTQREFPRWERDLLSTFANQAATAFENVRRQRRIEHLVRIGETVTSETAAGLKTVLEKVAKSACELAGADYAVIYPYDPERRHFYDVENVVVYGLKRSSPKAKPRERGLAAIVRDIDELVVHDVDRGELDPVDFDRIKQPGVDAAQLLEFIRQEKFVREENVKAFVGLSLKAGSSRRGKEQEVGVLYIDFRHPHHFTDEELDLIRIFGHQVGSAIRNAHLLERERYLRQQAETLREVSGAISRELGLKEVANKILDELGKVIEYRKTSIQLIRRDRRLLIAGRGFDVTIADEWFLRPVSQDRLIKRLVKSKKPRILSDTSKAIDWEIRPDTADVKSWVGLPLVYGDATIGLLTLDHDQPGYYTRQVEDSLVLFGGQAAIGIQNALLFEDSQHRIRDLEIVNTVSQVISAQLDIQDVLKTIASEIVRKLDCTHCTVFLAQEEKGRTWLVPKVTHGLYSRQIVKRRYKPGEGLAGWVFQHGESAVVPNAREDPRFAPATVERDLPRSLLVVPIQAGDQTIGVISADQDRFDWFSESDRRLVEALGQHAGIAIERLNALELVQSIGSQIVGVQALDDTLEYIAAGATKLTNTTSGVIHLVGEDGKAVVKSFRYPADFEHPEPRISKEEGLTQEIVATGKMLILPDIRKSGRVNPALYDRVRSMIAIPLKLKDKVIGVLYLNDADPHDFTETEVSVLSTLASQAAIAIDNATLFQERGERAERLTQLQEITAAISAKPSNLDEVLDLILDRLSYIFPGASCGIRLYDPARDEFGQRVFAGALVGREHHTPRPDGTSRHVIQGKAPRYLEDALVTPPDSGPAIRQELIELGVRANACLPLLSKGNVIGLLYLDLAQPHRFSQNDQQILTLFADQVAIAIENARLYEGLQEELKRIAVLGYLGDSLASLE